MNFRTDLALECHEMLKNKVSPGIKSRVFNERNVRITEISVTNKDGAKALNKPVGNYITVETAPFSQSFDLTDARFTSITNELKKLLPQNGAALVVGLGNNHITPDTLGPLTIKHIFATRHIGQELAESLGFKKLRPVSAVAPGVLGQTGIETGEIIAGLVKSIKPKVVITIDALASRRLSRLGRTVQMADVGIVPGSGVGNARLPINEKTIGAPVIALGVPTVVDAATLAFDLTEGMQNVPNEEEIRRFTAPVGAQMMVTPREIDLLVERAAQLLSLSINCALQPNVSPEEMLKLTQQ